MSYCIRGTYTASQLADFIKEIKQQNLELIETSSCEYYNIPASFDIETSSFIGDDGQKQACMYIWQLGINGSVIYGRDWDTFLNVLSTISNELLLSIKRRLIIYVHNLGFEFQFIRKLFEWNKVFAIKQRRPVYAICEGLEFRCSYFLSNYSLQYIGDNLLHKYPVRKLVGDLDYSKIRHSRTPLNSKELQYCINDVLVVMSYIQEKIEQDGDISKIPLTNTGYVRKYCREQCFYEDAESDKARNNIRLSYRSIMKSLQIKTTDELKQLQRALLGGFTHASALYANQILYDVGSADLTSSYPFSMVAEYYPMSKGEYIGTVNNPTLFDYYLNHYCCLFDIEYINLKPKVLYENAISYSRCRIKGNYVVNNGRVVSADSLITTLTELDFDTYSRFYTWDSIKVFNMRVYSRGYLPKPLILSILDMYSDKTSLKGVAGKETEYLVSKNMINAAFGMMVTAIIRDEHVYSEQWEKLQADTASQLAAYNKNFNRFLYYGWGVWVTAHSRHNLFTAITEFAEDYVYSDTDSIKGLNFDDHMEYFREYNSNVLRKLLNMCNHYNIPFEKCQPKTIKGEKKLIGVWDREEGYKIFKTAGAKRYIYVTESDKLSLTVSGLNKHHAIPYLLSKFNNNINLIFEYFGEGMYIPEGHTGKLTLTYIDEETYGTVTDYLGVEAVYNEQSSTHAENQSYFMSVVGDYIKYLQGVQYVEL